MLNVLNQFLYFTNRYCFYFKVQAPVSEEERSKKSIKQKINKEFWAALQKEGL